MAQLDASSPTVSRNFRLRCCCERYPVLSEFGGGEREPCLHHVYGATHRDHGKHAQCFRARAHGKNHHARSSHDHGSGEPAKVERHAILSDSVPCQAPGRDATRCIKNGTASVASTASSTQLPVNASPRHGHNFSTECKQSNKKSVETPVELREP